MDNRSFISRLSKNTNKDTKTSSELVNTLVAIIADSLAEGDDVAVPGFGTFVSTKNAERVSNNPTTGESILLPPNITSSFKTGSRLKKAVKTS